jgi:hypothetical protein
LLYELSGWRAELATRPPGGGTIVIRGSPPAPQGAPEARLSDKGTFRDAPEQAGARSRLVAAIMADITPDQARSYFSRWDLAREMETKELQRTSIETKLQQLAALMASRHLFAPDANRETQADQVRERWARLRTALGG